MKQFINIILAISLVFMFMGCASLNDPSYTKLPVPLTNQAIAADGDCITIAKTSGDTLYHGPREVEVKPVPEVIEPAPITTTKVDEIIFFPYDSSEITDVEMVKINNLVAMLTEFPDTKIVIAAYASIEGAFDYNLDLSCRRGDAVTDELIAQGIDVNRITTLAYGETDTFSEVLKLNRRAIVVSVE